MIATFNRKATLAECLRTLSNQDLSPAEFEIVVVVDGSTDGTVRMLRSLEMRARLVIVEQLNKGQAAARNAGVERSNGELILLLDDDMLCEPNLLSAHCEAHKGGEAAVVSCEIRPASSPFAGPAERLFDELLSGYFTQLKQRPCPVWSENAWVGPNCSMPRKVFLESGGFDDTSFPRRWEDVELGMRLWKLGIPFRYVPQAAVVHQYVKQPLQSWTDTERDGASIVRLCRKHPEARSDSAIYAILGAARWKRLAARMLSSQSLLGIVILGALVRLFEMFRGWGNADRFSRRLFGFQRLVVLLAGARREAGSWRQLTRLFRQSLPVLLYHHVGTPNEVLKKTALSVSPGKFRRQMFWLNLRGFRPITSAQWLAWSKNGVPLPKKPVLLTFDDGYSDLIDSVFPIMERDKFSVLVFVITRLSEMVAAWEASPLLTFEAIRQWAARGVEFGGHTRTHADMTLISAESAAEEVRGCRNDLARVEAAAISFAYPYGSVNEQARRAVEGVFDLAFTCEEGLNDLKTDPLLLKRTMVHPGDTLLDLEFRLRFGRSPLDWWRSKLRIRSRFAVLLGRVLPRT